MARSMQQWVINQAGLTPCPTEGNIMKIKLEIGKSYKTRDGKRAIVVDHRGNNTFYVVHQRKRIGTAPVAVGHKEDGSHVYSETLPDGGCRFDIIAPWGEE